MVDVTTAFKNECEANVGTYKFGKVKVNLIDNNPASWEIGEYSSSNGTKIDTANMTRLSSLSKCEPNKQYTVSLNNSNFRLRLAYFNASQTYISSSAALTGGTITTPANTAYIGATLWNNANTYTGTNINIQNSTNDKLVSYNLEGQTTQNGTPTPTNPVEVQTVKGRNLFDIGQPSDYVTSGGAVSSVVQSTTNDVLSVKILGSGGTYNYNSKTNYIGGKTYTITGIASKTYSRIFIRLRKADNSGWMTNSDATITNFTYNTYYGGWFSANSATEINKTIAVPDCNYFQIGFGYTNSTDIQVGDIETISKIQVEENSSATPYLPYNTIQAKVVGKNLLENNSITQTKNGVTYTVNQDKSITLNGTSTQAFVVEINNNLVLDSGNYNLSLNGRIQGCGIYAYVGANVLKVYVSSNSATDNYQSNFTLDSRTIFTQIRIDIQANKTFNNVTIYPQLEKSSTATTYEAYKSNNYPITLGDIELCKIGTYQDRIYKNNGKWYLYKAIGKVVLNGTESWNIESSGQRYTTLVANSRAETQRLMIYSNYFHYISSGNEVGGGFNYGSRIFIYPNSISSVADLKTWLSTHNTIVYYMLATPTFTEITDENLISQLEALNNAQTYSGITNILSSGNLPAIMNIETDLSNNVRDNSAEPFMGFNITGDNDLISFKVTAKADSNGKPFGSVVKKQLDIEAFNENNKYDLENRQVKVSTGLAETTGNFCEWETFNITQTKDTQTKGHAQYTGYDNMVRATTPYVDNIDFGDSGITLYEFANEVVKQLGSTLGNEELPNGDFIITGNPFTNNETLEVVLRQLGELNGSFVEIGRDNKVWFRQIENTVSPMALSTNLYTEDFTKADKFGGVNKVVVGESNIETNAAIESDPTEIAKNGEQLIEVLDNYFMITMEQKEEICSSLWSMLEGFEYYPFKTKYNGFPYIDLGDNLEITDINNNNYLSVVLNYDFTYKGGYLGNVGASALSRTASKYKNSNTLGKQFRKVGIEVNRVEGKITAEIQAATEGITEAYGTAIEASAQGIMTTVNSLDETVNGDGTTENPGLVGNVSTINQTMLTQDSEAFTAVVKQSKKAADGVDAYNKDDNLQTIRKQVKFDSDGLTLSVEGTDADKMKLNLTNDAIRFKSGNTDILIINGSKIEFSNASFQKLDLGRYVWQAEQDDSLSLIYEGGNN